MGPIQVHMPDSAKPILLLLEEMLCVDALEPDGPGHLLLAVFIFAFASLFSLACHRAGYMDLEILCNMLDSSSHALGSADVEAGRVFLGLDQIGIGHV